MFGVEIMLRCIIFVLVDNRFVIKVFFNIWLDICVLWLIIIFGWFVFFVNI